MELVSPTGRVRRRQSMDYLGRGLFLIHYRMFGDYEEVSLEVKHGGKHVASSPYALGPVFHEDCYCPLLSVDEWLRDFNCPTDLDPQIVQDLEPFRDTGINVTELFRRASEGYRTSSFIHYSIIDHKVGVRVYVCTCVCVHTYLQNSHIYRNNFIILLSNTLCICGRSYFIPHFFYSTQFTRFSSLYSSNILTTPIWFPVQYRTKNKQFNLLDAHMNGLE